MHTLTSKACATSVAAYASGYSMAAVSFSQSLMSFSSFSWRTECSFMREGASGIVLEEIGIGEL